MRSKICSVAVCHGARESCAPTHGCASIASNTPTAILRIVSRGVARGEDFAQRAGDDGVAGGDEQLALVRDVPVDRAGSGRQPRGERAEGQPVLALVVEQLDRRVDDPLA